MKKTNEEIEKMADEYANQWMDGRESYYAFKAGFEKAQKLFTCEHDYHEITNTGIKFLKCRKCGNELL